MADPTLYQPGYDFTASDKGAELNTELANVQASVASVAAALADIRRADGKLKNRVVGADALDPMVLTQFSQIETELADELQEAVTAAATSATAAAGSATAASTARNGAVQASEDATLQAVAAASSAGAAIAASDAATAAQTASVAASTTATAASASATASASAAAASAASAASALAASRIAFSASKSADQTGIVTGTATKITFPTEVFDFGGHFGAADSRFTPPAGRYRLSAGLGWSGGLVDGRQLTVEVWKNGAVYRVFGVQVSGTTDNALVSGACLVEANGTDYFEVYATGWGTGNKTVAANSALTFFEGEAV